VGALADKERPTAQVAGDAFAAPNPIGAGLITAFLPFDRASLDRSLSRLLQGLADELVPVPAEGDPLSYPLIIMTAVVAIEATRRLQHRLAASGTTAEWKKGSPAMEGLS
jgi:hypothetical protein